MNFLHCLKCINIIHAIKQTKSLGKIVCAQTSRLLNDTI